MNKKYKFTGETIQHEGITLHRIQALRSFGDVKEGDIGGWIQKESNLSHEGACWVYGHAQVYGSARVYGDAQVYGYAQVCGNAQVYGSAQVYGHAQVCGNAQVYGPSQVCRSDWVYGHAHVMEDAEPSSGILPEELKTLPESIEEVTIKGVKYKKVTKWERA